MAAPALAALFSAACFLATAHAEGEGTGPQPEAAAPFMLLGAGECLAPGFRAMRGRSRRDTSHAQCRGSCVDKNCVGYTYTPCQRVCAVHGDPARLVGVPDSEGWSTTNGGGRIERPSGACGSSCYVRMGPCPAGDVLSSGTAVPHADLPFGAVRDFQCPHPFVGSLSLRCELVGITVVQGRCSRPCAPGTVMDRSFEVNYPPILHGEIVAAPCPQGSQGAILLRCADEQVTRLGGRCGFDCPPGALRAGSGTVQYPQMLHEQQLTVPCPEGYGGEALVECVDSLVGVLEGRCDAHCLPGELPLQLGNVSARVAHGALMHGTWAVLPCSPEELVGGETQVLCLNGVVLEVYNTSVTGCKRHCAAGQVGQGTKAVQHGLLEQGLNHTLPCMPGFGGQLLVHCEDGQTQTLSGECNFHCANGTVTSNSVTLRHGFVPHMGNITLVCPQDTHSGNLETICMDGAMRYNGTCGGNCAPGLQFSNNANVSHGFLRHGDEVDLPCPAPWGGFLRLRCYDTTVHQNLSCGRPCEAGARVRNSARIANPTMLHEEVVNSSCASLFPASLTFSGIVRVTCLDSRLIYEGDCWPDCSPGKISDNGADIEHGVVLADTTVDLTCSPTPDYGSVTVICTEGIVSLAGGSCGAPCFEGLYNSPMTRWFDLHYDLIPHNTERWMDCPPEVSGRIKMWCTDLHLTALEGNCGERCAAETHVVYGASFVNPTMDHGASLSQPCLVPFSGDVLVSCVYGRVNVTSRCMRGCFASNLTMPGDALIFTPDFVGGARVTLSCPVGYAGDVLIECADGAPEVVEGTCDKHCQAGRYEGSDWDVPYYEMLHGELQERECPAGLTGNLLLRCERGVPVLEDGFCVRTCRPGYLRINGVIMRHAPGQHDQPIPEMVCPTGYIGSIKLHCFDGTVSVVGGGCFAHCRAGGIQGALYDDLQHQQETLIHCPGAGEMQVRCEDGIVLVLSGRCFKDCSPGNVPDAAQGVFIAHNSMGHGVNATGTCMGALGQKTVTCYDGMVSLVHGDGEYCYRHCSQNTSAVTPDGSLVTVPPSIHGERLEVPCPDGKRGTVMVLCNDTVVSVVEGACGPQNCAAGMVESGGVSIAHAAANNGRTAGPEVCGGSYLGEALFICRNGSTEVLAVTFWLPPWDTASTTTEGTSSTTTSSPTIGGLLELEDSYHFALCSCCIPPQPAPEVQPVPAVDYRTILWWALAAGGSGIFVTGLAGCWIMRPESWRRKTSRVAPLPSSPKLQRQISQLPEHEAHALELQLAEVLREKTLLEISHDEAGLKAVTLREHELRTRLALQDDNNAPAPKALPW